MKIYTTKWDHVTLHTQKNPPKIIKKKPVKSVASLELEC
jgi:hypothetical protein